MAKAGQVFITPDFTIRAENDGPLIFGARDGGVPWFEVSAKSAHATVVATRQRKD